MSLAFPDVNVWLALASEEHTHRDEALGWWRPYDGQIAFCRITQLGLLRLLTTAAVMNARPLSMKEAWSVYDGLLGDERVEFLTEPPALERAFRGLSSSAHASPKLWADAYLTALATECGASIVTFDRSLARRSRNAVFLR
jgi:toxin-antitoxin system PIN domain toxin